ncbi:tRNA:m(4)X modification enzyme TRM13 homolog [Triplophysa rosa]|uniref:tRNA:m(4)X modification enzyme TRM13 n=1 Tax=Triplophysa rosa TaxID=992332 RepID=A0A9W7WA52_TRIRA|nr:tRNA:m(4)X modification enzyme TRM13 homolog [Triplophysa rosa]KAI7791209.1 tRNA:m4X modification enzyme TRM13-like protein [Triplophysa rosa]
MEASTAGSVSAPLPGRCAFYVTKKKRYCKMTVGRGKTFCGEHANAGGDTEKKRIPCPLDPKHTVYEDNLAKHLKKCNSKEKPQPRYYVKDINAGSGSEGEAIEEISIADRTKEELDELIVKLKTALQELNTKIVENTLSHNALNEALNDPKNGDSAIKHLKQQASILGNMEALKLLSPDRCYIEFGAGKGKLSHWIHVALKASENVHFLLVERSSTRFKVDGKHKNADSTFDRLQVDIQHLDLNRVPLLREKRRPVVGVGKHLCGAATDLALRCLFERIRKFDDDPPTKRVKLQQEDGAGDETKPREGLVVSGLAIALCCHHRCDWRHYVGKEFFRQRGLGPKEFTAFQRMSSWATCGMKKFSSEMPEQLSDHKTEEEEEHEIDEEAITDSLKSVMSVEDREQIGRLCKLLIDQGRVHYLQQRGFESSLKYYTSRDVSLENVLLTAVPSSNQNTDESKLNTNST